MKLWYEYTYFFFLTKLNISQGYGSLGTTGCFFFFFNLEYEFYVVFLFWLRVRPLPKLTGSAFFALGSCPPSLLWRKYSIFKIVGCFCTFSLPLTHCLFRGWKGLHFSLSPSKLAINNFLDIVTHSLPLEGVFCLFKATCFLFSTSCFPKWLWWDYSTLPPVVISLASGWKWKLIALCW